MQFVFLTCLSEAYHLESVGTSNILAFRRFLFDMLCLLHFILKEGLFGKLLGVSLVLRVNCSMI